MGDLRRLFTNSSHSLSLNGLDPLVRNNAKKCQPSKSWPRCHFRQLARAGPRLTAQRQLAADGADLVVGGQHVDTIVLQLVDYRLQGIRINFMAFAILNVQLN